MKDITALRAVLFDTLAALQDKDNPMDIERARAINETAQVLVNTAKAEVDYLKLTNGKGTGFVPEGGNPALPNGCTSPAPGVYVHRLKG